MKRTDSIKRQLNVYKMDIHSAQSLLKSEIDEIKEIKLQLAVLEKAMDIFDIPEDSLYKYRGIHLEKMKPWAEKMVKTLAQVESKLGLIVDQIIVIEDLVDKFRIEAEGS